MSASPKALLFDVFGTVVDWRSSVVRELELFGARHGFAADWTAFADAWRGAYQPSMEEVRSGARAWTLLDALHRESLVTLLGDFDIPPLDDSVIDDLNMAWHRLDPWPDCPGGLRRLSSRHIIATCSNGNVSLMVDVAKRGGLPWDMILGAEIAQAYKRQPAAYLASAKMLDCTPQDCMMVAAHNDDLDTAQALGFKTAFVARPTEHGPNQTSDLQASGAWDHVCVSMHDLADQLGC